LVRDPGADLIGEGRLKFFEGLGLDLVYPQRAAWVECASRGSSMPIGRKFSDMATKAAPFFESSASTVCDIVTPGFETTTAAISDSCTKTVG
jgi:hypothetical protein